MIDMEITKFDIVYYLNSEEVIAKYLNTVLEDGDRFDVMQFKSSYPDVDIQKKNPTLLYLPQSLAQ